MDWTIFLYIFQALIGVGMFLKCFKVSKNKKFESSSQKNKQALNSPAKDSRKVEKGEKKEEKVQTPTTPKPEPDEIKMTSKEERIAQGKEVRKKTDYATFLDVCSDWEDTSHSDAKKDGGNNVKQAKNGKAVKNDEAKIEPKKGNENKPEKKSENKSVERGNKDNERKSEKETKDEDDSTQKEGGQGKPAAGIAGAGESSTTRDTEPDAIGAPKPAQTDHTKEKKAKKSSKTEKLNTV